MGKHLPMTIYYDGSCPLCCAEIDAIMTHDTKGFFTLVDCSAADFDDTPYRQEGITREAMMSALHVRDAWGAWYAGVDAFELIYRTIGQTAVAWLWGGSFTRPLTTRLYPWIARHRRLFTRIGLPRLFRCWARCAARRSERRVEQLKHQCQNGKCTIEQGGMEP